MTPTYTSARAAGVPSDPNHALWSQADWVHTLNRPPCNLRDVKPPSLHVFTREMAPMYILHSNILSVIRCISHLITAFWVLGKDRETAA